MLVLDLGIVLTCMVINVIAYPSGAHEFTIGFRGVRVAQSLVLCRSLFVFLSFFFWPLCCLSFFWLPLCYLQAFLVFPDLEYTQRGRNGCDNKTSLNPPRFYWTTCIMPGNGLVCLLGLLILASFYNVGIGFRNCSDMYGHLCFSFYFTFWSRLTTLVVLATGYIGSSKSNYHDDPW
jgi:hypothetical protein